MDEERSNPIPLVPGCKYSRYMPRSRAVFATRPDGIENTEWVAECHTVADFIGIEPEQHKATGTWHYVVKGVHKPLAGLLGKQAVIWLNMDLQGSSAICTLMVDLYIEQIVLPVTVFVEGFDASYPAWAELGEEQGDPRDDSEAMEEWRKIAKRMVLEWRNVRLERMAKVGVYD